jgi:hypothetical protein
MYQWYFWANPCFLARTVPQANVNTFSLLFVYIINVNNIFNSHGICGRVSSTACVNPHFTQGPTNQTLPKLISPMKSRLSHEKKGYFMHTRNGRPTRIHQRPVRKRRQVLPARTSLDPPTSIKRKTNKLVNGRWETRGLPYWWIKGCVARD